MSIQALVGIPGHGKSYSAIELFLLEALRQERRIVTNIPITEALLEDFPKARLLPMDLDVAAKEDRVWDEIPPSCLILLDELWRIWPAGLKAHVIPKRQLSFIKEHRHHIDASGREPDIILVTQDLGDIAAPVRNMIETTVVCTKLTDVGLSGRFRRDYYRGAVKGFVGPKQAFIRSDHARYEEKIWRYYKSHTKATAEVASIDQRRVVNATIFNGWGFRLGLGFLVAMVGLVIWSGIKTKSGIDRLRAVPEHAPKPVAPAQRPVAPVAPPVQVHKESKRWRLSGNYRTPGAPPVAVITDGVVTRRLVNAKDCQWKNGIAEECEFQGEIVAAWTGRTADRSEDGALASVAR